MFSFFFLSFVLFFSWKEQLYVFYCISYATWHYWHFYGINDETTRFISLFSFWDIQLCSFKMSIYFGPTIPHTSGRAKIFSFMFFFKISYKIFNHSKSRSKSFILVFMMTYTNIRYLFLNLTIVFIFLFLHYIFFFYISTLT